MAVDPILRIRNNDRIVDFLAPNSGWMLEDPYWQPQIAQYKGGGTKVNSSIAAGQRLVHKEYDNVVETIPLVLKGNNQQAAIQTLDELMLLAKEASDYWTESYQLNDAWVECQLPCENALTGYAVVYQFAIPELKNPFGQPFFSSFNEAIMNGITLTLEREPLWRGVQPGSIIGPLYNMLKNPDFEFWNFGTNDSQPDNWTDLETIQVTGQNSRHDTAVHSGNYCLKVRVSGSTLTGRFKGITQVIASTRPNTQYTIVAWVRSEGVSNGVGRILVTYSSQLELYRSATRHGWTVYANTFTTGASDVVAVNCEILTTGANTDGTVYFDSLMLLEGDWVEQAELGILPYISSSHIVNRNDQPEAIIFTSGYTVAPGNINYVDAWDVPGNDDANVRIEMLNNNTPADPGAIVETISTARISMRRAGDIFLFANFYDPIGEAVSSNASSYSTAIISSFTGAAWTTLVSYVIDDDDIISEMSGRYRLFVRMRDAQNPSALKLRVQYWIGANEINVKTLDPVTMTVGNNVYCVMNLTLNSSINWDFKFNTSPPGRLGFNIQASRPTGSANVTIDYAYLMPTDGGMMISDLEPSVLPQTALVIDEQNTAYSVNKRVGWREVYRNTTPTEFLNMHNYGGALFITTGTSDLSRSYKYLNGTATQIYGPTTGTRMPMVTYNGRLHVLHDAVPAGIATPKLYSNNGDAFLGTVVVTSFNVVSGVPTVYKMVALGTWIWFVGGDGAGANVWYWTGAIGGSGQIFFSGGTGSFRVIEAYNGKIYAGGTGFGGGGNETRIYELTPIPLGTNSVSNNFGSSNGPITAMKAFNGKLYASYNGPLVTNPGIYQFDGVTWTRVYTFTTAFTSSGVMEVFNNTLFAGVWDSNTQQTKILQTTDGTTWAEVYAPLFRVLPSSMAVSEGQLFLGSSDGFVSYCSLWAIAFEDIQHKVSNYQLSPFASPPKKRHRFFFNWDRANYVNNADDKALVGLGFIPRYRTLRGSK